MSTTENPLSDGRLLAEAINGWLETDLGQHYLLQLNLMFNQLHQEAESEDLTAEQKAFKVERAAGLKKAITYLTNRDRAFKDGRWEDKPAA